MIRIGVGRDAAEVAFCSPFGPIGFDKPEVWINAVQPVVSSIEAIRSQDGA